MRRRTPDHAAASPLRRWSGVVALGTVVALCSLAAGGAAYAVVGVAATAVGSTGGAPDGGSPARADTASPATTATTPVTDDDGDDAADAAAVLTVDRTTVTLTDDSRGRTIVVTLRIPRTTRPVPVVVIVHGYAAAAADYDAIADALAAAGFAVVSPDFPLSSSAATTSPTRDIVAQATDVSFVLDALLDGSTLPTVTPRLDATRVAVLGHSDGGVTAAGVAFAGTAADPRIGAAVVLSGGAFAFSGPWFVDDTPAALLVVHGNADTVNPFSASTALYDEATGAKWLVAVEGGDHAGPFTDGPAVGDVATLVVTFLRATIGGDTTAAAALPAAADAGDLSLVATA